MNSNMRPGSLCRVQLYVKEVLSTQLDCKLLDCALQIGRIQ